MVKHRCLLFLLNPKCSMSGRAQPCPTRGLAHLVDSVHSQWGRMGHDLALCLSMFSQSVGLQAVNHKK